MLQLKRLEIDGFGPFADRQVLTFPAKPGVVVVYGENMRGKTTLLNAIRYAFFGKVLGRGRRERLIHSLSNRERATAGKFGFSVTLEFDFDGQAFGSTAAMRLLCRRRPTTATTVRKCSCGGAEAC